MVTESGRSFLVPFSLSSHFFPLECPLQSLLFTSPAQVNLWQEDQAQAPHVQAHGKQTACEWLCWREGGALDAGYIGAWSPSALSLTSGTGLRPTHHHEDHSAHLACLCPGIPELWQ